MKPELDGIVLRLPRATKNFYVDGHKPTPHWFRKSSDSKNCQLLKVRFLHMRMEQSPREFKRQKKLWNATKNDAICLTLRHFWLLVSFEFMLSGLNLPIMSLTLARNTLDGVELENQFPVCLSARGCYILPRVNRNLCCCGLCQIVAA